MIRIEKVVGPARIEDLGRPGRLAQGIPRGGALVPEALARAQRAVGNRDDSAGIERCGAMTLRALTPVVLGDDEEAVHRLAAGEARTFGWDGTRRVRYLVPHGGIDVPLVHGARGLVSATGLGGFEGRALAAGDTLRVGAAEGSSERRSGPPDELDDEGPIRVVPGPDLPSSFAWLVGSAFRVSPTSDRSGTRLEGPAGPWPAEAWPAATTPMVPGAIELPRAGQPIVLGPDHPTTGGYPVIGVVASWDLGRFHRLPLGAPVSFAEAKARMGR